MSQSIATHVAPEQLVFFGPHLVGANTLGQSRRYFSSPRTAPPSTRDATLFPLARFHGGSSCCEANHSQLRWGREGHLLLSYLEVVSRRCGRFSVGRSCHGIIRAPRSVHPIKFSVSSFALLEKFPGTFTPSRRHLDSSNVGGGSVLYIRGAQVTITSPGPD